MSNMYSNDKNSTQKKEFQEWIFNNYRIYYNYGFIVYLILHTSFIFFDLYLAKSNFQLIILLRVLTPIFLILLTLFIYNSKKYKSYFIYTNILTVTIIPINVIILSVICSGISQPYYIVYFGGINLLIVVTGLFIVDWKKTLLTNIFIIAILIFSLVKYSPNKEIMTLLGLLSIIFTVSLTSVFITYLNESVKYKIFLNDLNYHKEINSKNKFLNLVAHDLRSPISAIMVLTEIMNNEFDTLSVHETRHYIENLHKSIKNTFNFLNELLDWARIQSKSVDLHLIANDLNNIISNTISITLQAAQNKNINIINNFQNKRNCLCDIPMIMTVFRNLITNAIKFTNEFGTIIISSEIIDNHIHISVKDNGIGMSDKTKSQLFILESAGSSRGTAGEIGTGLGLILCKEIIDLHKGKIWAESEKGKGSTFTFSLPLA